MIPPAAGAARPGVIAEPAPAKLNLYLHVTGRRADGYHLLDSLVAFSALGDTLEAAPGEALSLELDGPFAAALAAEADNLVLRAARRLAEAAGRPPRASLRLIKRLPVASGIGGGSADAAAALRALMRLWRLHLGPELLHTIAIGLGADVPVCLFGRPAYVGGVGERLDPAPALPPAGLVLVNPGVALATAAVFKARTGAFSAADRFGEAPADAAALARLLAGRRNDLTGPATALCPVVGKVLAALEQAPGCLLARMSGSGATCFGIFDHQAGAAAAAASLAAREPGWWVTASHVATDGAAWTRSMSD